MHQPTGTGSPNNLFRSAIRSSSNTELGHFVPSPASPKLTPSSPKRVRAAQPLSAKQQAHYTQIEILAESIQDAVNTTFALITAFNNHYLGKKSLSQTPKQLEELITHLQTFLKDKSLELQKINKSEPKNNTHDRIGVCAKLCDCLRHIKQAMLGKHKVNINLFEIVKQEVKKQKIIADNIRKQYLYYINGKYVFNNKKFTPPSPTRLSQPLPIPAITPAIIESALISPSEIAPTAMPVKTFSEIATMTEPDDFNLLQPVPLYYPVISSSSSFSQYEELESTTSPRYLESGTSTPHTINSMEMETDSAPDITNILFNISQMPVTEQELEATRKEDAARIIQEHWRKHALQKKIRTETSRVLAKVRQQADAILLQAKLEAEKIEASYFLQAEKTITSSQFAQVAHNEQLLATANQQASNILKQAEQTAKKTADTILSEAEARVEILFTNAVQEVMRREAAVSEQLRIEYQMARLQQNKRERAAITLQRIWRGRNDNIAKFLNLKIAGHLQAIDAINFFEQGAPDTSPPLSIFANNTNYATAIITPPALKQTEVPYYDSFPSYYFDPEDSEKEQPWRALERLIAERDMANEIDAKKMEMEAELAAQQILASEVAVFTGDEVDTLFRTLTSPLIAELENVFGESSPTIKTISDLKTKQTVRKIQKAWRVHRTKKHLPISSQTIISRDSRGMNTMITKVPITGYQIVSLQSSSQATAVFITGQLAKNLSELADNANKAYPGGFSQLVGDATKTMQEAVRSSSLNVDPSSSLSPRQAARLTTRDTETTPLSPRKVSSLYGSTLSTHFELPGAQQQFPASLSLRNSTDSSNESSADESTVDLFSSTDKTGSIEQQRLLTRRSARTTSIDTVELDEQINNVLKKSFSTEDVESLLSHEEKTGRNNRFISHPRLCCWPGINSPDLKVRRRTRRCCFSMVIIIVALLLLGAITYPVIHFILEWIDGDHINHHNNTNSTTSVPSLTTDYSTALVTTGGYVPPPDSTTGMNLATTLAMTAAATGLLATSNAITTAMQTLLTTLFGPSTGNPSTSDQPVSSSTGRQVTTRGDGTTAPTGTTTSGQATSNFATSSPATTSPATSSSATTNAATTSFTTSNLATTSPPTSSPATTNAATTAAFCSKLPIPARSDSLSIIMGKLKATLTAAPLCGSLTVANWKTSVPPDILDIMNAQFATDPTMDAAWLVDSTTLDQLLALWPNIGRTEI